MKPTLLAAIALLITTSLTGCASIPSCKSGAYDGVADASRGMPMPSDCGDEYQNRYSKVGCGGTHCGLCGITGGLAHESCALVNCLFSTRWEGDYPHGGLGPWAGSWNREPCCSSYEDDCEEVEYVNGGTATPQPVAH